MLKFFAEEHLLKIPCQTIQVEMAMAPLASIKTVNSYEKNPLDFPKLLQKNERVTVRPNEFIKVYTLGSEAT